MVQVFGVTAIINMGSKSKIEQLNTFYFFSMLQTLLFNLKWGGLMFSIIFIHVPLGIGIGFLK